MIFTGLLSASSTNTAVFLTKHHEFVELMKDLFVDFAKAKRDDIRVDVLDLDVSALKTHVYFTVATRQGIYQPSHKVIGLLSLSVTVRPYVTWMV